MTGSRRSASSSARSPTSSCWTFACPRLNGLDFLRALDRLGLKTPVVVCSALVPEDGGFSVPGVRAAQKTADLRHVRAAVEEALAEHAATPFQPAPARTDADRLVPRQPA